MTYNLKSNGDWLEQQAAEFITANIPAYELIWQIFIGHQGDGKMAIINNINSVDRDTRESFSQHHYTILESLYFMQLIVDDESKTPQIKTFNDYRVIINQLMAFQAYSGRLRDNMEKCFSLMASKEEARKASEKLDTFYHQRHVFVHGRKVPFVIDADQLFRIATIKKNTTTKVGYGLGMPWESVSPDDLVFLEDALKSLIDELKPVVQSLLAHLFSFVKSFIESRGLSIASPFQIQCQLEDLPPPVSGSVNI